MNGLIYRQAAIDAVNEWLKLYVINRTMSNITSIQDILRQLPSAQPEREKGAWTNDASCPFCGFQPWYEKDIHTLSFCPNCGADMRGEQDE